MDRGPVWLRPAQYRGRRSCPAEQSLFAIAVVKIIGQRPVKTDFTGSVYVVADGCSGQADGDADGPRTQMLGLMEPQDFSDLSHGSTGTGHRLVSSTTDTFEERVADATGFMPPLESASKVGQNPWVESGGEFPAGRKSGGEIDRNPQTTRMKACWGIGSRSTRVGSRLPERKVVLDGRGGRSRER